MASPTDRPLSTQYFVNGVAMYEPDFGGVDEENNSIADESSGHTQDGIMHINWLLSDIPKLKFSYDALTPAQYSYMKNLVQGKTFQFTFPAPDGTSRTVEAYCSTSSATRASAYLYNGLYRGFKFDVIGTGA